MDDLHVTVPGIDPVASPWSADPAEVARRMGTDLERGLDAADVQARFERFGPNELRPAAATPLWKRIGRQFTDPLVVVLIVAIAISLSAWSAAGRHEVPLEAIVIAAVVILNATIGTWQEERALRAVAALQRLSSTASTVRRDGRVQRIESRDLVPGDVLELREGDAVGADSRLFSVASLHVAEAALTGESEPVAKSIQRLPVDTPLADRVGMAYQGTAVTRGRGVGVVVATGRSSELGRIAELIKQSEPEPTPLEREISWLSRSLGAAVLVVAVLVVVVIGLTSDVRTSEDVVDALLVGVSLAVAAVPEGLPAVLTIVLAIGVRRMAADRAVVKRLSSVETLGSASVICTDKTGTLTSNQMTIVAAIVPAGLVDLTEAPPGRDPEEAEQVRLVLAAGATASDASMHRHPDGKWEAQGDPTEVAFLVASQQLGFGLGSGFGSSSPGVRIDEIPFHSDRKLMSTVERADRECGQELTLFTKGAPDVLIDRCTRERVGGSIRSLTPERRTRLLADVDALAAQALRPLAVAFRPYGEHELPADPGDEVDLVLLGVVGMVDPPREGAADAVAEARRGGIRVVMVTGDHAQTAHRIAVELGIGDGRPGTTGSEIGVIGDGEFAERASTSDVFARVDPEHKLRLVRVLQADGQVIAMTGDGVNDAPALRQADIGIAMGRSGTEVAKEAADMILEDDDFATILRAVRTGREIFADIRKFLRFLLASNAGEVLVVVVGVAFAARLGLADGADGLAVPLLATQILWINLVTDGLLALALGVDPPVEDVMNDPPRPVDERVIDARMLRTIVVVGLATAAMTLVALDLGTTGGPLGGSGDVETGRTMAFTTLVLAQLVNALNARSDTVSAFVDVFANRLLWAAIALSAMAQVLVVHLPGLNTAFGAVPLTLGRWAICVGLAIGVLVVTEATKAVRRRAGGATGRSTLAGAARWVDTGVGERGDPT